MESLARLIPFVIRQRRALLASVILSIGTAVFAVAQLSLVYPTMKLLLEGQTYDQHIKTEHVRAETQVTDRTNRVLELEGKLTQQGWLTDPAEPSERYLRRELRKAQTELRSAQWNVSKFGWLKNRLVPLLPTDAFNFLAFILAMLLTLTLFKETCAYFQEMCGGGVVQRVMQSVTATAFPINVTPGSTDPRFGNDASVDVEVHL